MSELLKIFMKRSSVTVRLQFNKLILFTGNDRSTINSYRQAKFRNWWNGIESMKSVRCSVSDPGQSYQIPQREPSLEILNIFLNDLPFWWAHSTFKKSLRDKHLTFYYSMKLLGLWYCNNWAIYFATRILGIFVTWSKVFKLKSFSPW